MDIREKHIGQIAAKATESVCLVENW